VPHAIPVLCHVYEEYVMKKQLGVIAFCGAMLMSSQFVLAQAYRPGPPPPQPAPRYRGMYDQGRHEGWYKRGGYVPAQYRRGNYVVSDWRRYRLKPPPRGYQYIRSDNGDFLLAAITTGAILSIIAAGR
jgi:Ni/Co efflux regulator RcnB